MKRQFYISLIGAAFAVQLSAQAQTEKQSASYLHRNLCERKRHIKQWQIYMWSTYV